MTEYITMIGAVSAIIISIFSLFESKRKLITSAISSNRIKWIADVREAMNEFLAEYLKGLNAERNQYNLRIARAKIELFMSGSKTYKLFLAQLEKCSTEDFSADDYNNFIIQAQDVLNSTWRLMKREAGITYKREKRLTKKLELELKDSKLQSITHPSQQTAKRA